MSLNLTKITLIAAAGLLLGGYADAQSNTSEYPGFIPGKQIRQGLYTADPAENWIIAGGGNFPVTPNVTNGLNNSRLQWLVINHSNLGLPFWAGEDFEAPKTVRTVGIYPITRTEWLLHGATVEGSNDADFATSDVLLTLDSSDFVKGQYTYFNLPDNGATYQYMRIQAPSGGATNTFDNTVWNGIYLVGFRFYEQDVLAAANAVPYSNNSGAKAGYYTGRVINSWGDYLYNTLRNNTAQQRELGPRMLFDDQLNNQGEYGMNGARPSAPGFIFDLGTSKPLKGLGYVAKALAYATRMNGFIFELSDDPTFATVNGSYTLDDPNIENGKSEYEWYYINIPESSTLYNATGRYIRVSKGPTGGASDFDMGELRFYGVEVTTPVRFGALTHNLKNAGVELRWTSFTETNTARYDVEASVDGADFKVIGTVPAKGPSGYSFLDQRPLSSVVYYRVVGVDNDGGRSYSDINKVAFNLSAALTVSPNPASSEVKISGVEAKKVVIYDLSGRQVLVKEDANVVNIEGLAAGVYLVQVTDINGVVSKAKLVKK